MTKYLRFLLAFIVLQLIAPVHAMAERPIVLELFTSQGCSSCPPADDLLTELAKDPSLLALSFHIDYWDYLGWKDPYALSAGTARQHTYASHIAEGRVFTPQLVVDGQSSVIGSKKGSVAAAIEEAKKVRPDDVSISFSPDVSSQKVAVALSAVPLGTEIWLVYFNRRAETDVRNGENGGRKLRGTNIVTDIKKLDPSDQNKSIYEVAMPKEGVAVIVQTAEQGKILGAGSYFSGG